MMDTKVIIVRMNQYVKTVRMINLAKMVVKSSVIKKMVKSFVSAYAQLTIMGICFLKVIIVKMSQNAISQMLVGPVSMKVMLLAKLVHANACVSMVMLVIIAR